eukprot:3341790-Prymnesium_polylepis.2
MQSARLRFVRCRTCAVCWTLQGRVAQRGQYACALLRLASTRLESTGYSCTCLTVMAHGNREMPSSARCNCRACTIRRIASFCMPCIGAACGRIGL